MNASHSTSVKKTWTKTHRVWDKLAVLDHIYTDVTYESTWFSKDRMTGYGDVLKALSAIASITSCSPRKNEKI